LSKPILKKENGPFVYVREGTGKAVDKTCPNQRCVDGITNWVEEIGTSRHHAQVGG